MNAKEIIYLASDHAGVDLKKILLEKLSKNKLVVDLGPHNANSVDYPRFAKELCLKLQKDLKNELPAKGILICGSGVGMSIAANKFQNIRAALCSSEQEAELSRRHNNSNVLCLGARMRSDDINSSIVNKWTETSFEGGRHQNRLQLIEKEEI